MIQVDICSFKITLLRLFIAASTAANWIRTSLQSLSDSIIVLIDFICPIMRAIRFNSFFTVSGLCVMCMSFPMFIYMCMFVYILSYIFLHMFVHISHFMNMVFILFFIFVFFIFFRFQPFLKLLTPGISTEKPVSKIPSVYLYLINTSDHTTIMHYQFLL